MMPCARTVLSGVGGALLLVLTGAAARADDWYRERGLASYYGRLLLDSRVVGCADVVPPNCCHPFLLEALLFQWAKKGVVLLGPCLEHKPPESNKSVQQRQPLDRRCGGPRRGTFSPHL